MADAPISPTAPTAGMSRRQVLQTATAGTAAAFLAACTRARKKPKAKPGQSGLPVATTLVAPVVSTTAPTQDKLDMDVTVKRTGSSLELLAAEVYATYGPKLKDAKLKAAAARFRADHEAAAEIFRQATPTNKQITKPNEYVMQNVVDPVKDSLPTAGDPAILEFLQGIESTLVATYVTAAGTFTSPEWRNKVMTIGSASARRVGVLANAGAGGIATAGLYPVNDLISNNAYLLANPAKKSGS